MWWNSMTAFQQVMFIIACAASAILVIQIILMIIGGATNAGFDSSAGDADIGGATDIDADTDIDVSIDADSDVGVGASGFDLDGTVSDVADGVPSARSGGGFAVPFGLRLLSFRSIIAFIAVGCWVGYTLCYVLDWYYALVTAIACGLAAACCMAAALVGMEKLQSSGNINPTNAVGKIGTVYLTVPPKRSGRGKVNVLVQERYTEYEAVTDGESPLPTASEIIVKAHIGANVLLVEKHVKPSITVERTK